ncbi:glutathione peroxidase, partial [Mycobacterium asiaticum]|uniref:glutathione peroxidase n=1 Tax=Mycobacterium asiaticum TaxID=1790 RepID=UPI0009B9015C
MTIKDIPLTTLDGKPATLAELSSGATLVVNVASKCGLTPQYAGLEKLAKEYGDRGLTVVGVPCNQFMGQEPGTAEEIQTFCSTTYGVTFPLLAKTDVNGDDRHPLYAELTKATDADGKQPGTFKWNIR